MVVFLPQLGEGLAAARLIVEQPDVPQGLGEQLLARLAQQFAHVRIDVGNAARIGIEQEHAVRRCLEQPAIAHLRCIQRRAGAPLHEVDSGQQEAEQNPAQGDVRRNAALRCLFEFRARGERHAPGAPGKVYHRRSRKARLVARDPVRSHQVRAVHQRIGRSLRAVVYLQVDFAARVGGMYARKHFIGLHRRMDEAAQRCATRRLGGRHAPAAVNRQENMEAGALLRPEFPDHGQLARNRRPAAVACAFHRGPAFWIGEHVVARGNLAAPLLRFEIDEAQAPMRAVVEDDARDAAGGRRAPRKFARSGLAAYPADAQYAGIPDFRGLQGGGARTGVLLFQVEAAREGAKLRQARFAVAGEQGRAIAQ